MSRSELIEMALKNNPIATLVEQEGAL